MPTLQGPLREESNFRGFEEVYKTSYSHGLEAIYALENVDIKSVRKMAQALPQPSKEPPKPQVLEESAVEQYEFDLGAEFRSWIRPFLLNAPIEALSLSPHIEKMLKDLNRHTLGAVLEMGMEVKGLGKSQLQELRQRLQEYIAGRPLHQTRYIDFDSWVLSLTAGVPRKKLFILLSTFDLSHLITLSSMEALEVRRLNKQKTEEWSSEAAEHLRHPEKKSLFTSALYQITEVFLKPWMRGRLGLAGRDELEERVEKVSFSPQEASKAIHFFEHLMAKGSFYGALFYLKFFRKFMLRIPERLKIFFI